MTDEMLALAQENQPGRGQQREFLKGTIEAIPLPDASVDVVISNCVVNLSATSPAVLAETDRVLKPGGRLGISGRRRRGPAHAAQRAARGSYVGCIAGALSTREYVAGLEAAGFEQIRSTHPSGGRRHARGDRQGGREERAERRGPQRSSSPEVEATEASC